MTPSIVDQLRAVSAAPPVEAPSTRRAASGKRVGHENDALRTKIAEMERQEPVGEIQRANSTGNYINSVVWVPMAVGSKLYALPGAKGEKK